MIGLEEITKRIPHRYPMLLVDRVNAVVPGQRLSASKAITCTEPCFRPVSGDYAYAAYPTHLVVESWAQAALLLVLWDDPQPDATAGLVALAGAIEDVRIFSRAYPGDVLEHRVRLVRSVGDTAILLGETMLSSSSLASSTVLEVGRFVAALRPAETLRPAQMPRPIDRLRATPRPTPRPTLRPGSPASAGAPVATG